MGNLYDHCVEKVFENLMYHNDKNVRIYLITNAPIELVIQMALKENDNEVIKSILKILNNQKENDILKKNYLPLLKAVDWRIRQFALTNISFNEENIDNLINMALIETDHTVAEKIANILSKNVHLSKVTQNYSNLAEAKNIIIQKFVVNNAPMKVIIEMSKEQQLDYNVAVSIIERCIKG